MYRPSALAAVTFPTRPIRSSHHASGRTVGCRPSPATAIRLGLVQIENTKCPRGRATRRISASTASVLGQQVLQRIKAGHHVGHALQQASLVHRPGHVRLGESEVDAKPVDAEPAQRTDEVVPPAPEVNDEAWPTW
jgi:hypothetical protein